MATQKNSDRIGVMRGAGPVSAPGSAANPGSTKASATANAKSPRPTSEQNNADYNRAFGKPPKGKGAPGTVDPTR